MSFFDCYPHQTEDDYLAAHGGEVPAFEQVLADVKAAQPDRGALLAFLSDALRRHLVDICEQRNMSAQDVAEQAALAELMGQIEQHPDRIQLISIFRRILALGTTPQVAE